MFNLLFDSGFKNHLFLQMQKMFFFPPFFSFTVTKQYHKKNNNNKPLKMFYLFVMRLLSPCATQGHSFILRF